jgi:hypothetical protein
VERWSPAFEVETLRPPAGFSTVRGPIYSPGSRPVKRPNRALCGTRLFGTTPRVDAPDASERPREFWLSPVTNRYRRGLGGARDSGSRSPMTPTCGWEAAAAHRPCSTIAVGTRQRPRGHSDVRPCPGRGDIRTSAQCRTSRSTSYPPGTRDQAAQRPGRPSHQQATASTQVRVAAGCGYPRPRKGVGCKDDSTTR